MKNDRARALLCLNKRIVKNKTIDLKNIKKLPKKIKEKVIQDLKKITRKREFLGKKSHAIMGVINMTPDSFSDGGKYNTFKKANQRIKNLIKSGADIIDVGGESTRPGSKVINPKNELERVKSVIKKFKKSFSKTLLSIDTRKSQVIDYALKIKVDIVNDVSCFKFDQNSHKSVRNKNIWKIIHHMQGTPQTMQTLTDYGNEISQIVMQYFHHKLDELERAGITEVILDPGFGFSKTVEQSHQLLSELEIFQNFRKPILAGISRKSMIYKRLGISPEEALNGTSALNTIALSKGAKILRVHDVKPASEIIRLLFGSDKQV